MVVRRVRCSPSRERVIFWKYEMPASFLVLNFYMADFPQPRAGENSTRPLRVREHRKTAYRISLQYAVAIKKRLVCCHCNLGTG